MRISQLKASVRNWSLNHLWFVMEHLTKTAILLATCLTVVLSQSLNVCEYRNVSKSLSERHLPSGRHGRREPAGPERFGHGHQVPGPEQPGHRQQADRGGLLAGRGSL